MKKPISMDAKEHHPALARMIASRPIDEIPPKFYETTVPHDNHNNRDAEKTRL